jgi:hypothetical protein
VIADTSLSCGDPLIDCQVLPPKGWAALGMGTLDRLARSIARSRSIGIEDPRGLRVVGVTIGFRGCPAALAHFADLSRTSPEVREVPKAAKVQRSNLVRPKPMLNICRALGIIRIGKLS